MSLLLSFIVSHGYFPSDLYPAGLLPVSMPFVVGLCHEIIDCSSSHPGLPQKDQFFRIFLHKPKEAFVLEGGYLNHTHLYLMGLVWTYTLIIMIRFKSDSDIFQ